MKFRVTVTERTTRWVCIEADDWQDVVNKTSSLENRKAFVSYTPLEETVSALETGKLRTWERRVSLIEEASE